MDGCIGTLIILLMYLLFVVGLVAFTADSFGMLSAVILIIFLVASFYNYVKIDNGMRKEVGLTKEDYDRAKSWQLSAKDKIRKGQIDDNLRAEINRFATGKPASKRLTDQYGAHWAIARDSLYRNYKEKCGQCTQRDCKNCEIGCLNCETPTYCVNCSISLHLYEQSLKREAEQKNKSPEEQRIEKTEYNNKALLGDVAERIKAIDARCGLSLDDIKKITPKNTNESAVLDDISDDIVEISVIAKRVSEKIKEFR